VADRLGKQTEARGSDGINAKLCWW